MQIHFSASSLHISTCELMNVSLQSTMYLFKNSNGGALSRICSDTFALSIISQELFKTQMTFIN